MEENEPQETYPVEGYRVNHYGDKWVPFQLSTTRRYRGGPVEPCWVVIPDPDDPGFAAQRATREEAEALARQHAAEQSR